MSKKKLSIAVIVLFVSISVIPDVVSDAPTNSIIYVDDDADPSWYDATHVKTIQEGVNNATAGDTVFVYNGTYYENVIVNKTIDLIGEDRNNTIIDGNVSGDVICIIGTNEVNISNFTLRGSDGVDDGSGISLYNSDGCFISDNEIIDNYKGIFSWTSTNFTIVNCNISDNWGNGIQLHDCSNDNIIYGNVISNNENQNLVIGEYSDFNSIFENTISGAVTYGLEIKQNSNFNLLYHNNFINNNPNAYDIFTNTWDDGYPSGGNYWSDYTETDANGDGIGDSPYDIPGGSNQDNYPFMNPSGWINNPPNEPSNPSPFNGQINASLNPVLYWTGGDIDPKDTITYDVYFGVSSTPPLVLSDYPYTTFFPGSLQFSTLYFWAIVARDNHGATTEGPLWNFTTMINSPPKPPSNPFPTDGATGVPIDVNLSWTGGDPDQTDVVTYDVFFGSMLPIVKVASNVSEATYDPGILANGLTYYWHIVAWDNHGHSTTGEPWHFTTAQIVNNPPNPPTITGKINGSAGKNYKYTFNASDPDGHDIYYEIEWGDGISNELGPFESGEETTQYHSWDEENTYIITARAKDVYGAISNWNTLVVTMPKNKAINTPFLQFLENHPHLFPLLRQLLGL